MRLFKGCVTTIGVMAVLFLLALVAGYYSLSLPPPIKAQITPVVMTAEAAQSLNQKFQAFKAEIEAAVKAGQEKKVSLTITEEEANSKLVEFLAEKELPLEKILINFGTNSFLGYVVLDTPVIAAKVGMTGKLQIVAGKPKIVIEKFNLGRLPLPKGTAENVTSFLNSMVKSPIEGLPLSITEIQIVKGQLIITGIAKKP